MVHNIIKRFKESRKTSECKKQGQKPQLNAVVILNLIQFKFAHFSTWKRSDQYLSAGAQGLSISIGGKKKKKKIKKEKK